MSKKQPRRYLLAERTIDRHDLADLIGWLRTDPWLTQGPLVAEFERRWARWLGVRHATFVNSGSSANLLMYDAMLRSGRLQSRKVIVPAVSWVTSVTPALQLGLEPIMCDAEPRTFGLDTERLEGLLKKHRPGAVLIVHVLGVPNEMEALLKLQKRYGFILLEDACAATGSKYAGRRVGTFGDLSTFSFFFGHHLSTIEGGMVCTSHEDIHDLLLLLRSHGWPKDLSPKKEARLARVRRVADFNRPFTFYEAGYNLRSTDLNARIGLSQLKKVASVVRRRAENHKRYQERLREVPGLHIQENPRAAIASISFVALAPSSEARDRIAAALRENRIETRPLGGGNMSRQPFWADRYGPQDFPVADRIQACAFQLPNHPGLSREDIDHICDVVVKALTPG